MNTQQISSALARTQITNLTLQSIRHRFEPLEHLSFIGKRWLFLLSTIAALSVVPHVHADAVIDYVLTAPTDPVKPGQVLEFDVTVRNLSAAAQVVAVNFTVPEFTTYNGNPAGTATLYNFGTVAPGASETAKLLFVVSGANLAPPDGTVITLMLTDEARGVTFSDEVVVQSTPALNVQLSTAQGTVAPGGNFNYTVVASNTSGGSRICTLTVPVPAGASFVSADGGGVLTAGVVTWHFGTLANGSNVQVHVSFKASAIANTPLGKVEATFTDLGGDVAQASDTRAVYAAPAINYVLTAPTDPVKPGQVLEFDVTVRNLSAAAQVVAVNFTVPEFTTYNANPAGTATLYNFGTVAPGASETAKLLFVVSGANLAPPDGTTINLVLTDLDRAGSVSRAVVVRAAPALNLQLSTEQGTVAPGANFTYTLTASNISGVSHAGVELSVPVPAGASFVSADGGGVLSAGVVNWSLGTSGVAANEQLHVTFKASATVNTPLGPVDATLTDSAGDVARASDTRAVYAAPAINYVLTAPTDPVKPGQVLEFDVTVRNLSAAAQVVAVNFTVPEFTTYNANPAGTATLYNFGTVAPGASETAKLLFVVSGANLAPPDGTTINLVLTDLDRAGSVSRAVVVRAAPALSLQLSTEQGTVAPGANFTYTLTASNISGASHAGAELSVPVPAGATFVSADSGGAVSAGVVTWDLGTLTAGTIKQVHVTFKASATVGTPLGPVDATLADDDGNVTRASDTRPVYAAPDIDYTITSPSDPVKAGDVAEFDVTVSNLSASSQVVAVNFTVPEFTTYNGNPAGTATLYNFGTVAPGASETAKLLFTVDGGNTPPPGGATITLDVVDLARAGSVSRTIFVASRAPQNFGNISTRLSVGIGDNVLIGGFIITGADAKNVILRGIGPSLPIPGALANPFLELHDSAGLIIASNDDWVNSPNKQAIIDSTIPPTNDKESAIIITLDPGAYTAIVRGVNNTTGVALVEVYDLDQTVDSKLANISTRGFVQTGDNVMIGGLIILSNTPTNSIVRAIGPSLPVTGKLADPTLELYNVNGDLIASNDNWRSDQEAEIIATGIPPTQDAESAIVATLDPGAYTAIVRGVNNTSGVALVELYDLQQ